MSTLPADSSLWPPAGSTTTRGLCGLEDLEGAVLVATILPVSNLNLSASPPVLNFLLDLSTPGVGILPRFSKPHTPPCISKSAILSKASAAPKTCTSDALAVSTRGACQVFADRGVAHFEWLKTAKGVPGSAGVPSSFASPCTRTLRQGRKPMFSRSGDARW